MVSAAALPTRISTGVVTRAPPENALICAVPDCPFGLNVERATPPSVRASRGSMMPTVEVKLTTVPLCTGVPAGFCRPIERHRRRIDSEGNRRVGRREQSDLIAGYRERQKNQRDERGSA
jgi:hypothetical protein